VKHVFIVETSFSRFVSWRGNERYRGKQPERKKEEKKRKKITTENTNKSETQASEHEEKINKCSLSSLEMKHMKMTIDK